VKKQFEKVAKKYHKDDIELIRHFFARLPDEYIPVKVTI
jgi:hypothetical protein